MSKVFKIIMIFLLLLFGAPFLDALVSSIKTENIQSIMLAILFGVPFFVILFLFLAAKPLNTLESRLAGNPRIEPYRYRYVLGNIVLVSLSIIAAPALLIICPRFLPCEKCLANFLRFKSFISLPYISPRQKALHFAAASAFSPDDLELIGSTVKYLVSVCKEDINCTDDFGGTPLHSVVTCKSKIKNKTAEILLKLGADVNAVNKTGRSALHNCVLLGNVELAQMLINNGANANQKDIVGRTPLFYACHYKHNEVVEFLVNNGADVNSEDEVKMTPLMWAARSERLVFLLLRHGADKEHKDIYGLKAVDYADNDKVIELLENFV